MRTNGIGRPGIGTRLRRLAAIALMAFTASVAGASAQGKRLGLVIGLADYGDVKHPTALQDAGLVAQSLKQAGFELTEAANLTQGEFRNSFRDFVDKASAAGPDTVIAVYLAGVGVQDDGENILVPTGARLRQRSDLALEGLRISDFLRSLGGVPSAGRIVMLDASYSHPIGQLVAEGGRGLASVEKRDGLLVAFNQSPDQVAALPRTNYGFYAMALAEALREPGLDLNAVFERVRLRAHDLSQGAETPWHLNGLSQPIVLVPGVAGAPIASQAPEAIEMRRRPVRELGADDAYARVVELDTIPAYEDFLKAYPTHAQAKRVRAMIAARREAYYWQRARRANTDRAYWTYLRRYPRGAHAGEAEARLSRLSVPLMPPPQFEEVIYDDLPPPPPEEIEVYEAVIAEDRWDVLPPPSGYGVHFLPPPPVEIIELAPPPPNPTSRLLPAVVIGAGVVGAAILANRAWRRPEPVRPVVTPPIVRPPRPPVGQPFVGQPPVARPPVIGQPPVGVRPPGTPPVTPPVGGVNPPVGQPPVVPPVGVRPPGTPPVTPPVGGVNPPVGQPPVVPPVGVRPPGTPPVTPPVGGVNPPVGQPPVGVRPPGTPPVTPPVGGVNPPVGQPGKIGPAYNNVIAPPGQPSLEGNQINGTAKPIQPIRPGAIMPPPTGGVAPPAATPPRAAPPSVAPPPAAPPAASRPTVPPPVVQRPPVVQNPNIGPRPPTPPSPPGSGPAQRPVRQ
ncbi:MAG: hypothetical protein FD175_2578, partial [Beijerinckiaceae bacterium]